MFILGANLTQKSVLGQLEPFMDMMDGNPNAISRWAAAFGNLLLPLGSQRNELGRLMSPGLKELDQEFKQLVANRNVILKNTLPDQYSWITGEKIGHVDNWLVRILNTYAPTFNFKGDSPNKVEQFLIDIEYNGRPSISTDGSGNEYKPSERSELQSLIGEEGLLAKEINEIRLRAKNIDLVNRLKRTRRAGYTSEQVDSTEVADIHRLIDLAINRAVRRNEYKLSNIDEILNRRAEANRIKVEAKSGILPHELPLVPSR
jgi:hypothetical protein